MNTSTAPSQRVIDALVGANTILRLLKIDVTPHREITKIGEELKDLNASVIPEIQALLNDENYPKMHRKILAKVMGYYQDEGEPEPTAAVG